MRRKPSASVTLYGLCVSGSDLAWLKGKASSHSPSTCSVPGDQGQPRAACIELCSYGIDLASSFADQNKFKFAAGTRNSKLKQSERLGDTSAEAASRKGAFTFPTPDTQPARTTDTKTITKSHSTPLLDPLPSLPIVLRRTNPRPVFIAIHLSALLLTPNIQDVIVAVHRHMRVPH